MALVIAPPSESTMYCRIDPSSMNTFFHFAIKNEYARIAERGNCLGDVSPLIDKDAFRPLLSDLYTNAVRAKVVVRNMMLC